jgi:hypothetical protein
MISPLAFLRALERVRACFEDESSPLSLRAVSERAGVPVETCAAAVAALAHSGLVKCEDGKVGRPDAFGGIQRRTA